MIPTLAELFNSGGKPNYQESTLKCYTATGHASWNRNFSRLNFHVIPLSPNGGQHQYYLPAISLHCQEIRLWELIKWSPKRKCFDLLSNSLNTFFNKMYRDQFGEFVFVYWGLKGYSTVCQMTSNLRLMLKHLCEKFQKLFKTKAESR